MPDKIKAFAPGGLEALTTYIKNFHADFATLAQMYLALTSGTAGQYIGYDANGDAEAQTPDTTPTQGSSALITSGGVYAALGDVETLLAAI